MSAVVKLYESVAHLRTKRADDGQLELGHDESAIDRERQRSLRDWASTLSAYRGLKVLAGELGMSESHLSHSLRETNGNRIPLRALPTLVRIDPSDDFAKMIASWRGMVATRQPNVTAEEALLGLLEEVAEQMGPKMSAPLLEGGYRRALARARRGG